MDTKRLLKVAQKMLDLAKSDPTSLEKSSLPEFWDKLNSHDHVFYHQFSDDPKAAAKDKAKLSQFHEEAKASDQHHKMLEGFKSHYEGKVSGKHAPKPERPKE